MVKKIQRIWKRRLINKKAGAKKKERKEPSSIEDLIVELSLDTPFGPERIAYELKMRGISISPLEYTMSWREEI